MKIAVGSDHAGYQPPPPLYKPAIMDHIRKLGHEVIDCGTNGPESVDYPDFAEAVCRKLLSGDADLGVVICGTGIGVSIAANRHKGIRAAICMTPEIAEIARQHNDANVLALGRRQMPLDLCLQIVEAFLSTPFSGEARHARRIAKLG